MDTNRVSIIAKFSLVLGMLALTPAFAAPVECPSAPLTPYLSGSFVCTEDQGTFTFFSFSYSAPMGGLNSGQINVTPIDQPGKIGFLLTSQQPNGFTDMGAMATYQFSYFIDPPPPIIRGEQIDLDPIGNVTLTSVLCSMNTVPCPMANTINTLTATTGTPTATTALANLSILGVQNTLTVNGTSAPAASGGFDNITLVTPEPAAAFLLGGGLLGLLAFRSRAKVRQVLGQLGS